MQLALNNLEVTELSFDELYMVDGGGVIGAIAEGVGYAAGYVYGAVSNIVSGLEEAARNHK